jgi:hypothetical protein
MLPATSASYHQSFQTLDVAGDINLTGTIFSSGTSGAPGEILSSTGTGLQWIDSILLVLPIPTLLVMV